MIIKKDFTVLFQGDSTTDCGREVDNDRNLGAGHPMFIAALFNAKYPNLNVKFLNKGISGNRTIDLKNRWQSDCIDLKPDVVSILIGINDCWRRFDSNDPTSADQYENNFRYILNETKEKTNARIIICEPFLLPVKEEQKNLWRDDLDPKIQVARKLSREFNTIYIPYDGLFASKLTEINPSLWAEDGVHPTLAGHALMAQTWLEAIETF